MPLVANPHQKYVRKGIAGNLVQLCQVDTAKLPYHNTDGSVWQTCHLPAWVCSCHTSPEPSHLFPTLLSLLTPERRWPASLPSKLVPSREMRCPEQRFSQASSLPVSGAVGRTLSLLGFTACKHLLPLEGGERIITHLNPDPSPVFSDRIPRSRTVKVAEPVLPLLLNSWGLCLVPVAG